MPGRLLTRHAVQHLLRRDDLQAKVLPDEVRLRKEMHPIVGRQVLGTGHESPGNNGRVLCHNNSGNPLYRARIRIFENREVWSSDKGIEN